MPEINMSDGEDRNAGEEPSLSLGSGPIPNPNPSLFKKYELGKLLGCGAFAKVYHARVVRTGQSVAIKAINKQRIQKGNLAANIKREITIMRRLRHPHIVSLHEVLATKTKVYFVMEFAKGGELFAKVAKGRFSEDLCRKYFQQLVSAVDYCHSHGVFHRDLKPENLLLDDNWDLKVTDFGLCAVTGQTRQDGLLHTMCGTPAYVAPEILAKKGYDGAKVDVWSCGIILYVLNAGYLPFNDTNLMAMYRKIYKGQFRCPKWTSPELRRFLSRVLDPNPDTRITVHEMLNDPWFRKGYKEMKQPVDKEFEFKDSGEEVRYLNAFDLISYSPGADLSGLFDYHVNSEMFVSDKSPETIIGRLEVGAEEEGMRVTKKGMGVRLHGQNWKDVIMVEMNRLTEQLVVVEVKSRSGFGFGFGFGHQHEHQHDLWLHKFKPRLHDLVYNYIPQPQPQPQVPLPRSLIN